MCLSPWVFLAFIMNENLVGDISIADKDTVNKKEPDSRPGT